MPDYTTTRQKRTDTTDARAHHIPLGVDERGAVHSAHTSTDPDQVVVAYPDGTLRRKQPPTGDRIDIETYVDDVGEFVGWAEKRYDRNLLAELAP